ncbi:MAG: toprim domain-containing protein [Magnetococcales bacterium]|nr:toprim domain-containing protein [Magnetococcales bacterium]
MDIHEIKSRLTQDAARVVRYLLPNGKLNGREWEVGSINGEPGKSLKVNISGVKAGVWSDFADSGMGGDLLDLWCKTRRITLAEALSQIKDYLGIHDPVFHTGVKKDYRKPERPKCCEPREYVFDYLTEKRGLPMETIRAYKIGERDREIVFPSLRGKELIAIKYMSVNRTTEGKKIVHVESNCEPCLFGWQVIPDDARTLIITEGEIDAMSVHALGFPAVSVPFGAGTGAKHSWVETEYHNLERFEEIFLCMDADEEGRKATMDLVDRLGRHRCRIVSLMDFKDANDFLLSGAMHEDMAQCLYQARHLAPDELKCASEYMDEVIAGFYPPEGMDLGMELPFGKLKGKFRCRPGELTVWTGSTGSGKSQVIGFSCAVGLSRGIRACIASLEMEPKTTLMRLARQLSGQELPSKGYLQAIHKFYDGRLYLCTVVGKSRVERLLEIFEYARRRFGVDVFVVDSLMRLGVGADEYGEQEKAMFKLIDFAVQKRVHVHLVAHARKADTKFKKSTPDVEDIKGASELGSNAFNVISISRNKLKEEKIKEAERTGGTTGDVNAPCGWIKIGKQRNGSWEGTIPFWFDKESFQYLDYVGEKPKSYVNYSGNPEIASISGFNPEYL